MRKGRRVVTSTKEKQFDMEKTDLRKVSTPVTFIANFYKAGNIFGPDAFYHELEKYNHCDALTYTVTDKWPLRTRRLIYCISEDKKKPVAEMSKRVVGNHAKLVIAYSKPLASYPVPYQPTAFLGSCNHTGKGNFNLMYKLSPEETIIMVNLFNELWETH